MLQYFIKMMNTTQIKEQRKWKKGIKLIIREKNND